MSFETREVMRKIQLDSSAKFTFLALLIYLIAQSWIGFPEQVISWDAFGYYLYLPFGILYNDLTFSDLGLINDIVGQYENTATLYQLTNVDNGNMVIKYPVGMAILMLPFFLIAHLIAFVFGFSADGFSAPYEVMVFVGHTCYLLLGIWYLRKLLLVYFSSIITGLVLFSIIIGTNFLAMGTMTMGNTHIPLFALHAIGLYSTYKWHKEPTFKLSLLLGSLIGLMIITRPTEILFLLIPFLWGVRSIRGLVRKYYNLFRKEFLKFMLVSCSILLVGFIQLLYWKVVTGSWLFYSYDNAGEGFEFLNPYTWEFLFSFRKGWLVYTPLMVLAIIGLLFTFKRKYDFGYGLFLFVVFNVWVLSSWSCWWYAGSFGQRSIVQSYPEMALALAAFLTVVRKRKIIKGVIGALIALMVLLNVFQTWQVDQRIIHFSRMTAEYYFAVFGRTSIPYGAERLLLIDRPTVQKTTPKDLERYYMDKELIRMDSLSFGTDQEFVDFDSFTFDAITNKDHAWIKITGQSTIDSIGADEQYLLVTAFTHEKNKYSYVSWPLSEMNKNERDGSITEIEIWYLTPEVRSTNDEFVFEIWNRAGSRASIKNLKIESFVRKEIRP